MKFANFFPSSAVIVRLIAAAAMLSPGALLAHPGHYHPDGTDEFDFFRSTFFHSHGAMDYLLAGIALSSVMVAFMSGERRIRTGAVLIAIGSLVALPIF